MNLDDFVRGWVVGNFTPALVQNKDVEVAVHYHEKGEIPEPHYQRIATEYNVVVSGKIRANGVVYGPKDIFVFAPYVVCECEVLEDCVIVCIKSPSAPEDKILCK